MPPQRFDEPIYVTRPLVPSHDAIAARIREICDRRVLTNRGPAEEELERLLSLRFDQLPLRLFGNGTLALMTLLRALDLADGDVVTTAFTFPATAQAIAWNSLVPVYADVDPLGYCLDPAQVERVITERTRAILAVHVYGVPCDVEGLAHVAARHGLPLLYDAAPAIGVRHRGASLASYGDASMLSFHATKIFSTVEGGALVARRPELIDEAYRLARFGFRGPERVIGMGLNGKLNELQAAFGLCVLDLVDEEIQRRLALFSRYRSGLEGVPGLAFQHIPEETEWNGAYCAIRIDPAAFGRDRDELCAELAALNVFARKYFFPLAEDVEGLPRATVEAPLDVSRRLGRELLCLPLYGDLGADRVDAIVEAVRSLAR